MPRRTGSSASAAQLGTVAFRSHDPFGISFSQSFCRARVGLASNWTADIFRGQYHLPSPRQGRVPASIIFGALSGRAIGGPLVQQMRIAERVGAAGLRRCETQGVTISREGFATYIRGRRPRRLGKRAQRLHLPPPRDRSSSVAPSEISSLAVPPAGVCHNALLSVASVPFTCASF